MALSTVCRSGVSFLHHNANHHTQGHRKSSEESFDIDFVADGINSVASLPCVAAGGARDLHGSAIAAHPDCSHGRAEADALELMPVRMKVVRRMLDCQG